jgi:hypothetical protein
MNHQIDHQITDSVISPNLSDSSALIPAPPQPPSIPKAKPQHNPHPRCTFTFATGRRCRNWARDPLLRSCHKHFPRLIAPEIDDAADLSAELTDDPYLFNTLDGIHAYLAELLILQTRSRISPRRAAVLAYIATQLVRTLTAINRDEASQQSDNPDDNSHPAA